MLLDGALPTPSVTVFGAGSTFAFRDVLTICITAVILYGLYVTTPVIRSWVRPASSIIPEDKLKELLILLDNKLEKIGSAALIEQQLRDLLKGVVEQIHKSTRVIVDEELSAVQTIVQSMYSSIAALEKGENQESALLVNMDRNLTVIQVMLSQVQRELEREHPRP